MKISELTSLANKFIVPYTQYAFTIVKDMDIAEKIVMQAFEEVYLQPNLPSEAIIQNWLKSRVDRLCVEWISKILKETKIEMNSLQNVFKFVTNGEE